MGHGDGMGTSSEVLGAIMMFGRAGGGIWGQCLGLALDGSGVGRRVGQGGWIVKW